ncbi:exodeoxyribonuclease VII large subunit [Cognatazoarcus halotolerans]|uniref:exodeoxyribonuclease VII large subunit n=1 Tax=Cognatazoarcus halotolerans TaxID=2686016 RepID=UPI00135A7E49|nr:exodeoxyribonuclease VII large subunit [Cognatazoarcus halotolerans]MCB1900116.1 exodeoxyribonuclease VII large subunit [Rhodocyclaceae bacterium]MCP5311299.1 exodeoxyribonuclease VII large subunit [Zoogloeaceae bacterium]
MSFANEFSSAGGQQTISVAELNTLAREALESAIPLHWVAGEISNLTRAASGHIYFTLKDAQAQVRCTLWRSKAQLLPFQPTHGQKVEVRALATLYEARGDFQLNVETIRRAGVGSLYEAFLALRERLEREGLFKASDKRPLPSFPRGVGIITSLQAAALRDVLSAMRRRAPHLPIVIYPSTVQGSEAPHALAGAIETAGARASRDGIDVLLLVRGGGNLEDLWPFNDEALARVIRRSPVPVITGIGHETDFTIADFVADLRAATPTAAAELATAAYVAISQRLAEQTRRLLRAAARTLENAAQRLDRAAVRVIHPRERLARARERLEGVDARLKRAATARLRAHSHCLDNLSARLSGKRPDFRAQKDHLRHIEDRLSSAANRLIRRQHERVDGLAANLAHLNPESVLARGYGIVRDQNGRIVREATSVGPGEALSIRLSHGRLDAVVSATHPAATSPDE